MKEKENEVRISVRSLVEFILRSGDIDSSHQRSSPDSMQEGAKLHRSIQGRMGASYRAEVPLRYRWVCDGFSILVEGRADGIFEKDGLFCIDEIKGVYRDVNRMEEPVSVHRAQAMVYGAIYLMDAELPSIGIQMTYCGILSREIKRFYEVYEKDELKEWFFALMEEYSRWAQFRISWGQKRLESLRRLEFPYEYRSGQKELCIQVYSTIYHKKRLFLEAPTGVGKTIAALFPSLKALGEKKADMIFYLTAKTMTGRVALDTFELLRSKGLSMKLVEIMAKEKLCVLEKPECSPDACPRARGHFDRINEAIYELITTEDIFSREVIEECAARHEVCPYELCLDLSLFADAVVCDYNYVFDPTAALKRFFSDSVKSGGYIFLIDEAHNLVDRAREMYTADLYKDELLEARRSIGKRHEALSRALNSCNRLMLGYMRQGSEIRVHEEAEDIITAMERIGGYLEEFMDDESAADIREEILPFYFNVRHFIEMSQLLDENYVIYTMMDDEDRFLLRLYCVNPAANLRSRLDRGVASCFFSATLLPVTYYMDLISGDRKDYAVYAPSPFDPANRGIFIATDVTSRYKGRGPATYDLISDYIHDTVAVKEGNYMVFFPSYRFLQDVYDSFCRRYPGDDMEIICQSQSMKEEERRSFLERFYSGRGEGALVGFCVLGGVFSEGIDLREDSLIGVLIVGTGIPQMGGSLDVLRDYFDSGEDNRGFDYAYRIPGMNKVLQSAGRVIRTDRDRGIVVLLDERFTNSEYRRMFPREWRDIRVGNKETIIKSIKEFW